MPASADPATASAGDPASAELRQIDLAALQNVLRRLARAETPPWLHTEVARRMAERLQLIRLQPDHIVDWGSFLGGGAALLAQAYPRAGFTAVEPNAALLARSQAALHAPWWSAKRWRGAAARASLIEDMGEPLIENMAEGKVDAAIGDLAAQPPAQAQLLWSNMALHAAADPPRVIAQWHRLLAPGGFAMFSCFGPDTLRELRALYAGIGRPCGIEFVDMHDLGDMMVRSGFADPVMDQETITLEWTSPAALLAELRGLGGNLAPGRPPGLKTRRWKAALEAELDALRGPGGRIGLRFEVAYGHAFKVAPRLPLRSETQVSLEDMRQMTRAAKAKP